jgi:hypothetical protein
MQHAPPSGSAVAGREPASLTDVVEKLFAEFESQLHLAAIYAVIRRCRRELDIAPIPPRPELIECRARQRLRDLVSGAEDTPSGQDTPRLA